MTKEYLQTPSKLLNEASSKFWWSFAFLFVAVLLFHGKTLPFSNEFVYLLRLEPNFLSNDWTFSQSANEHWLFNTLFSLPSYIFSLETVGWLGRVSVWSLCLIALLKLGKRWEIPYWTIAVSVFLWLVFAQAVVNAEWIFGGFEAKTVAYVCLLFALNEFAKQKTILPSILLGLTFSFHPAVGLWSIGAIGLVFLFYLINRTISFSSFVKFSVLTIIFALPGLLPLLMEQSSAGAHPFDDWRFFVIFRMPWHLDPFQFSRSGRILIYAMLLFNIVALWKSESFALRFLLKFQIALSVFFLAGVLFRWFEIFPLLRFMPMRLFPIFTPLFFMFTAFYFVPKIASQKYKIIAALFVIMVIALLNPFGKGWQQIQTTFQTWTVAPDDLQKTSVWISHNTPNDAVVIQPPQRREFWYYSHRASIVSTTYPTYNQLGEWEMRIADLTGNLKVTSGEHAREEIDVAYNNLSAGQIAALKTKYGATHLVSRANYPYPIIFETETYKVYQLP